MTMYLLPLLLGIGLIAMFAGNNDGPDETPDTGNTGGDDVNLTDGRDVFDAGEGDDTVHALNGFDDVHGGTGDDTLFGGNGKDLLEGDAGNDTLNGDNWVDGLFGGAGDDTLFGGNGDDLLEGGAGNDELHGDSGDDLLLGGAGVDKLYGGSGDDFMAANDLFNRDLTPEEFDTIRDTGMVGDLTALRLSGSDNDTGGEMYGGDGDDIMLVGNNNIVEGGAGSDDFIVGPWVTDGNASTISDFNPADDVIVVAYNGDTPPDLEIRDDGVYEVGSDSALVFASGVTFDQLQVVQIRA